MTMFKSGKGKLGSPAEMAFGSAIFVVPANDAAAAARMDLRALSLRAAA